MKPATLLDESMTMARKSLQSHVKFADVHGASRMTIAAVEGLTDLVEAMHLNIASGSAPFGAAPVGRTRGITGFVYRSVRGVTRMVGFGLDTALGVVAPTLAPLFARVAGTLDTGSSPQREATLAALNGVLGDYLENSANPLALPMQLRRHGVPLALERAALSRAVPDQDGKPGDKPGSKLLVLVHGLCMNDLQWTRDGHDHGASLERELGYTSVYLHYNSGRHISTNGRAFADLLEELVTHWPVPVTELVLLCHSMGGLVSRSAWHYARDAGHQWPRQLKAMVFLGTPHHGAPLERGGNWIDLILDLSPYTTPFSRLSRIRSAGITDLRHGYVLDEDWQDRDRFAHTASDPAQHAMLALPRGVKCYTIAATLGKKSGDLQGRLRDRLLGDGLVPLDSALGISQDENRSLAFPKARQWIAFETGHMDLLSRPDVYAKIRQWLVSRADGAARAAP